MDFLLIFIFLKLIFLILHSYCFYPLIINLIARKRKEDIFELNNDKTISILIAAYNEEKVIAQRIENIAKQNYDKQNIEVLIGSDCSIDKTNDLLLELKARYSFLKVFLFQERQGKALILNKLVEHAKNEILVFTDANTIFDNSALLELASSFRDEKTGGVSGRLVLKTSLEKNTIEEDKYWTYETTVKLAEGKLGILIGANGGIFAIKRSLYRLIPKKAVTDDLFISLAVLSQGYQFLYNAKALAYEDTAKNEVQEYQRKVRFSATNFQTLFYFLDLLTLKNPLLSFAFFSHKLIRWLVPLLLIFIFIINIFLMKKIIIFSIPFILQVLFYLFGLIGYILSLLKLKIFPFSLIYYFILANIAIIIGGIKFIRGKHTVIWQSTKR